MTANTRPEDTQALESEIRSLQAEMAQLDQMRVASYQPNLPVVAVATTAATAAMPANSMPTLPTLPTPDAALPVVSSAEQEAADLAAMKAEQEALSAAGGDEDLTPDTFDAEESMPPAEMVVDEAQMSRRAKMIRNALLTAKITEVSEEGYAGVQIVRQDGVLEQQILAVRRGDGIAGRVRVTQMYGAGVAVVDPIPGSFMGGNPTLQIGDELIVPPFN